MPTYRYLSNNSGGSWWLNDDHWRALEKAGWTVRWFSNRDNRWIRPGADGRWLGALAGEATIEAPSIEAAIESFQAITGEDYDAEGCNCCGRPHYITKEV
jgi:hypothetical protein